MEVAHSSEVFVAQSTSAWSQPLRHCKHTHFIIEKRWNK